MRTSVTIALSLIAHTNAGKTTLARTLLQRDVGEVRDEPHVTEFSEDHLLVRSPLGDELRLWDTPGLGDSVRLARRLRLQGRALGWFMTEVWDRWRDRAFWSTQQALRHVREHSQVVLYLVNAAESPEAASYIEAEMELLAWLGKPVLVLLNQLGPPRPSAAEAQDVQRWRRHLQGLQAGVQVLPMDAFARCWVQELTLLRAAQTLLDGAQADAMGRLGDAWLAMREATFDAAVGVLARTLADVACMRQRIEPAAGLAERVKRLASRLGPLFGADGANDPTARAQATLAARLDDAVRDSTVELLKLHGLEGRAQGEIFARVATQFELRERVPEGPAALLGGVLSGALAGLKADLATGGLTMGGGLGFLESFALSALTRPCKILVELQDPRNLKAERGDPEAARYLAPEPFIESDAPEILAEAEIAVRGVSGNRARAERLTRYVNGLLEKKPTISLPSAREVLRTKVGDCNEHTVLYVAMARALGMPARISVGLVFVRGAFYYHAWPEVYVAEEGNAGGGRGLWLPVDPTFNEFPADATHLRLARGGLDKQTVILPLIGRLKITVLELELTPDSTPILAGGQPVDLGPLAIPIPKRQSCCTCLSQPSRTGRP